MSRWLFLVLLIFFGNAKLLAQTVNGCGSGWSRPFVPDYVPLVGCKLKSACDNHDVCYGRCTTSPLSTAETCQYLRCKNEGDLFRDPACDAEPFIGYSSLAQNRKRVCDSKFAKEILEDNKDAPSCWFFSWFYSKMVEFMGDPFFAGIDPTIASTVDAKQLRMSWDAAREMSAGWDRAKIEAFVNEVDGGSKTLNFRAEVIFDKDKGLVNK